jgi:hypothetical protein
MIDPCPTASVVLPLRWVSRPPDLLIAQLALQLRMAAGGALTIWPAIEQIVQGPLGIRNEVRRYYAFSCALTSSFQRSSS